MEANGIAFGRYLPPPSPSGEQISFYNYKLSRSI